MTTDNEKITSYLILLRDWLLHLKSNDINTASALEYFVQQENGKEYMNEHDDVSDIYIDVDTMRVEVIFKENHEEYLENELLNFIDYVSGLIDKYNNMQKNSHS